MDDGSEFVAGPGDVTALPSGHDARVIGDEPVVVVDWRGGQVRDERLTSGRCGMARKMMDCRRSPSVKNCTLTIAGEEDEVLRVAVMHAVDAHGHQDTPELRDQVRRGLQDESAAR